jgi:hypothetical protein
VRAVVDIVPLSETDDSDPTERSELVDNALDHDVLAVNDSSILLHNLDMGVGTLS